MSLKELATERIIQSSTRGERRLPDQKSIRRLSSITDLGLPKLDKITPANMQEIFRQIKKILQRERNKNNNFSSHSRPSEILTQLESRSSEAHALVCSVNWTEDLQAFKKYFDHFVGNHDIEDKDINVQTVHDFLERHIEANELLTTLYEIEVAGRIGQAKKEDDFFGVATLDFGQIKEKLQKSIKDIEEKYPEEIKRNAKIRKTIMKLRTALEQRNMYALQEIFYKDICDTYAILVFFAEEIDIPNAKEALRALEGKNK